MFALKPQDQGTIVLAQQDYIPLAVESFLIDRKAQGVSPETLSFHLKKLKYFVSFCESQAVTQISQLTPDLIWRFILQLAEISSRRSCAARMPARGAGMVRTVHIATGYDLNMHF